MIKNQKIAQIIFHNDFSGSRTLTGLLAAINVGVSLDEEERLFLIVLETFKVGKHKSMSYIRHAFVKDMKFLKREFKDIEDYK